MKLIASVLLCAAVAVSAHRSIVLDQPSEQVSPECFHRSQPLLSELHSSLHAQRHAVHQQCHQDQENLNREQQEQFRRLNESVQECLDQAHHLEADSPQAAAQLAQSCEDSEHRVRGVIGNHVAEAASLHELCSFRLRHVVEEMRGHMTELMHVLAECAPQHACIMLKMSRSQRRRATQQVETASNGKVETICAMPHARLDHKLRRACDRYELSRGVVAEASNGVYSELHDTLQHHCRAHAREQLPSETVPVETPEMHIEEVRPVHEGDSDLLGGDQESRSPFPIETPEPPVEDEHLLGTDEASLSPFPIEQQAAEDFREDDHLLGTDDESRSPFPIDNEEQPQQQPEQPQLPEVHQDERPVFHVTEEHMHSDQEELEVRHPDEETVRIAEEFTPETPETPSQAAEEEQHMRPEPVSYGQDMMEEEHHFEHTVVEMPTERLAEELPSQVAKELETLLPQAADHFPFLGVGPVIFPGLDGGDTTRSPTTVGQAAVEQLEKAAHENLEGESEEQPDGDHHHHHHHRSRVTIIAVAAVACVVACAVAAVVSTVVLRRRHRLNSITEKKHDVVKRPLVLEDDEAEDLSAIKQNGFENPTYSFFEGINEEEA